MQRITEEQKKIAIENYAEHGNITKAAQAANLNRWTLWKEMQRSKVFKDSMANAKAAYCDKLEAILDEQDEVLAFSKVLPRIPLRIAYYDHEGILHHYIPDFIVKTQECFYLVETKGAGFEEMESAKHKARAARAWCNNVSGLGQTKWVYAMIVENDFQRYREQGFNRLVAALGAGI